MGRLIDADRLKAHYAWWGEDSDKKRTFDTIVDLQPTAGPEWVPMERVDPLKGLDPKPGFYLVTKRQKTGQLQMAFGHFDGNEWSGNGNFTDVLAWHELPEPYKGGE